MKSTSSTPRPAPPPIPLPGPDEPVPSNFLRNQQALLGIAGLVGNVNPTRLPQQTARGSTPSNPIIVEELGSTHVARFSHFDPSQLPPVNGEDAIVSLMRHKSISPVISSILKLLGNSPATSTHPFHNHPSSHPCSAPATTGPSPLKRRKLTSVPAGAVDWDVPYPFPEGEGPEAYHATWERERARHLITQLLESIKADSDSSPIDGDQVPSSSSQSSMRTSESSRCTLSPSPALPTTTNTYQHIIPDCTIDPALLAISIPPSATYNALSTLPALVYSPITSTDSSDGALTPPAYGDQDSVAAAKMLLQFAAKPAIPSSAPSHTYIPPTAHVPYSQTGPSHFSSSTHPLSTQVSRASSVQSTHKSTPAVSRRAGVKAIHKEDIIQKARERRRQIVGEIERAKVELWETSIEGGVLGHLMKDPTLS